MALPTIESLDQAYAFLARRRNITRRPSERALAALVAMARLAAQSEGDEPAAMFYAMCRFPRAFPELWGPMTNVVTLNMLRMRGLRLEATAYELNGLRLDVASNRHDYDSVRDWFASRQRPSDEAR